MTEQILKYYAGTMGTSSAISNQSAPSGETNVLDSTSGEHFKHRSGYMSLKSTYSDHFDKIYVINIEKNVLWIFGKGGTLEQYLPMGHGSNNTLPSTSESSSYSGNLTVWNRDGMKGKDPNTHLGYEDNYAYNKCGNPAVIYDGVHGIHVLIMTPNWGTSTSTRYSANSGKLNSSQYMAYYIELDSNGLVPDADESTYWKDQGPMPSHMSSNPYYPRYQALNTGSYFDSRRYKHWSALKMSPFSIGGALGTKPPGSSLALGQTVGNYGQWVAGQLHGLDESSNNRGNLTHNNSLLQPDNVFQFGGATNESTSRIAFSFNGNIYIIDSWWKRNTEVSPSSHTYTSGYIDDILNKASMVGIHYGGEDGYDSASENVTGTVESQYNLNADKGMRAVYSTNFPFSAKRNSNGPTGLESYPLGGQGCCMQYCYNLQKLFIISWESSKGGGFHLYSASLPTSVSDGDTITWSEQARVPGYGSNVNKPTSRNGYMAASAISYDANAKILYWKTGNYDYNARTNDHHYKYLRTYDTQTNTWTAPELDFDYQTEMLDKYWDSGTERTDMTNNKDPMTVSIGAAAPTNLYDEHPYFMIWSSSKNKGYFFMMGGEQKPNDGKNIPRFYNNTLLGLGKLPRTLSSEETEANSSGISAINVSALRLADITMTGTKGAPATAALDAIKDSLTGNKAQINRKRKAAIKLLFAGDNASTAKQLVIPRAKLALPNTFVQAKVVAVKPGTPSSPPEPVSVADMSDDEGFYSALADGEIFLVTLPSGNTYTFTRSDSGSNERYTVDISGGSWTGISVKKLTGCANLDTSDPSASGSFLVENDVVGIDGRRFFIGSVGDGGSEIFTGGDPYITPMYGNTYKLPVDEKIYRMFDNNKETDRFLINVEMKKPKKEYAETLNKKILALNPDADPNSVFFSEKMSFMTRVFIQCGNQGLIYDLEQWKLVDKTDNCHVVIEDMDVNRPTIEEYEDEKRVTRRMVFKTKTMGNMIVYVEKYENPQIRSGLNVSQNTNTTNFVGALIRQSKPESIQVNSLVSREMLGEDALVEYEADTLSIEYFGNIKTGQKGIRVFH